MAVNKSYSPIQIDKIIEHLYSAIIVEDANRMITLVNQQFCQLFGFKDSPEQLKGVHGDDLAKKAMALYKTGEGFLRRIENITQNQLPIYNEEIEFTDGRVFERDYIPFYSDDKNLFHFWQFREVTKYKQTERQLISSKAEVEKLNKTLEEKVEAVVKKSRETDHLVMQQSRLAAMGEMIGNIGHQWRQPLNILSLYIQDVRDAYRYQELDETYLDNLVKKCFLQIKHMSRTINDFRNFFHPHKEPIPFTPSEQINTSISILSSTLEEAGIKVTYKNGNNKLVNGFPNEFSQVIINLLLNCRDVYLMRKIEKKEVHLSLIDDGTDVIVQVKDIAGGIPTDVLPHIFDPYFTTKINGTGVGLYMSKMIMEHMNGSIIAENSENGATFTLKIPILR